MRFSSSQNYKDFKVDIENCFEERFGVFDKRFDEVSFQIQDCQRHLSGLMAELRNQLQTHSLEPHVRSADQWTQSSARDGVAMLYRSNISENPGSPAGGNTVLPVESTPLLSDREGSDVREHKLPQDVHEKLLRAKESLEANNGQSRLGKAVTTFLEDPESSRYAAWYKEFSKLFNVFAIILALVGTVGIQLPSPYDQLVDLGIGLYFSLEILIRFFFCPNFPEFFKNPMNMIDIFSSLPLLIALVKDGLSKHAKSNAETALLVIVPVIRLLRLVRQFRYIMLLTSAFQSCLESLPVLLYTMAVLGCIFTSLIFISEPRDSMASMSEAAWLVLATMTTVGYGDIVPTTNVGFVLTSTLMIVSSLYMAMPVAIVGWGFTETWGNRVQILLKHDVRERLHKWGFGAYDIPRLFELFDMGGDAEMDLMEFQELLSSMQIGFKDDEIMQLFGMIDANFSGSVTASEFTKTLYPDEYRLMAKPKLMTKKGTGAKA